MNKFIITCGTSQLDRSAIDNFGHRVLEDFDGFGIPSSLTDNSADIPGTFQDWAERIAVPSLLKKIQNGLDLEKTIGDDINPLGAELSTLLKLKTRKNGVQWNPKTDFITLLASETGKGKTAAYMVKILLSKIFEVPVLNINIITVNQLSEKPEDSDDALNNLAEALLENMDLEELMCDHYSLIMSGGFKSEIPCLTLASFFFGIELIYIFETSNVLQHLHPSIDLTSEKKKQFWKQTWEGLAEHGFKNQPSYVHTLMRARLKHPNRSF